MLKALGKVILGIIGFFCILPFLPGMVGTLVIFSPIILVTWIIKKLFS